MFHGSVGVLKLSRVNLGTLAVALFSLVLNKWIWHEYPGFKNWLTARSQDIIVGATSAFTAVISNWVPQVPPLVSVLFCIFSNDLEENRKSLLIKFEDDTETAEAVNNDKSGVIWWCCLYHLVNWR